MEDPANTTEQKPAPTPPAPAVKAPEAPKADPRLEAVDALVADWLATLGGGAIAQSTPAWNELTAAIPALKAAIIERGG